MKRFFNVDFVKQFAIINDVYLIITYTDDILFVMFVHLPKDKDSYLTFSQDETIHSDHNITDRLLIS